MFDAEWVKCLREVSASNDADIYFVSGGLNSPTDNDVIRIVHSKKNKPNALLLLNTFGGDADVAFRIARCFQKAYRDGNFSILVQIYCKSAGTLLALGADELILSEEAQLGPLDVQLGKPDALDFLKKHAFSLFEYNMLELLGRSGSQITTKTAAEIATKITVGLFQPIYSQLDPLRLGEYHRNMMVAAEYGHRLSQCKGNLQSKEKLTQLTHGYPSHGFVIDYDEAKTIFKRLRGPTPQENQLSEQLTPIIVEGLRKKDENGNYVAIVHYIDPDAFEAASEEEQEQLQKGIKDEESTEHKESAESIDEPDSGNPDQDTADNNPENPDQSAPKGNQQS